MYERILVPLDGSGRAEHALPYAAWIAKHAGTDRVTGSRTADTRAALVDYFREQGSIMIATEAGAEGINLQFCSLVVNYDLPWNPQRIEQRAGGHLFQITFANNQGTTPANVAREAQPPMPADLRDPSTSNNGSIAAPAQTQDKPAPSPPNTAAKAGTSSQGLVKKPRSQAERLPAQPRSSQARRNAGAAEPRPRDEE